MKRLSLVVLCVAVMIGFGQPPAAKGALRPGDPDYDVKMKKLFDFLPKEYESMLQKQKDRVSRSLLAISLSRVPTYEMTAKLLEMTKKETDPLVRAVAWECVLSRAKLLNGDNYTKLLEATNSLASAGIMRGTLRVAALDLLAISQPDKQNKAVWTKIFQTSDSRSRSDDLVIWSLGKCLAAWKSPDLVEYLIQRMEVLDDAWRAERVLNAAGCSLTPAENKYELGAPKAQKDMLDRHLAWWKTESANWKEVKVSMEDTKWRQLPPHIIASPDDLKTVDPEDKKWRKDLELRPPNLKSFDVGFVVDVTGSMDPALAWLKSDVKRMMGCLGLVSLEPRIGITFYRDHGDEFVTKSVTLTNNTDNLMKALEIMTCKGGGDIPEAVLEGVTECLTKNSWTGNASGKKVMVLVADAPAHPETQAQCEEMLKNSTAKGFKLYAVKLHGPYAAPDQTPLDALAKAGNGVSLDADGAELMLSKPRSHPREASQAGWNGFYNSDPVGRRVVSAILVDAINPQFADRVEPMVAVLWELLQEPTPEKQVAFAPQPKTDPSMRVPGTPDPGMKPKVPVKGPQDR